MVGIYIYINIFFFLYYSVFELMHSCDFSAKISSAHAHTSKSSASLICYLLFTIYEEIILLERRFDNGIHYT